MRRRSALVALALVAAGCAEKDELVGSGSGRSGSGSESEGKTLSGCLELWEGPHLGSTRMQYVAKRQKVYAKIGVEGGRCQVEYATPDHKIYGRFIEKDNATGAWSLDAEKGSKAQAERVVETANATGLPDGSLKSGSP